MSFIKEIRAIGLKDWLWWVVRLRRNEHHRSLLHWRFEGCRGAADVKARRMRAHQIAVKLDIHNDTYHPAYHFWLRMALDKGWAVPVDGNLFTPDTWMRYWQACHDNELVGRIECPPRF